MEHRRKGSHESGISDEAAVETHDLIHNAEVEEQKLHGKDALCADEEGPAEETGALGSTPGQPGLQKTQKGPLEKVKDALHIKK